MPDMSGVEFLRHATAMVPGLPTLMLTGYDVDALAMAALARPICLLRKPIRRTALLNAVREVVGEREAAGIR